LRFLFFFSFSLLWVIPNHGLIKLTRVHQVYHYLNVFYFFRKNQPVPQRITVLKKYNTVLKWFSTSYEIQPLLLSTWISHLHRYPVMKCINHSLIRYQRVVCQFHATSFWVVNVLRGGEENTCLELLGWEGGVHSPYIILNGWCQGDHQSRQKNKRVGQFTKLVTTDNNLNRHPSNCYELIMRNFLVFNLSTTRQYFFFRNEYCKKKKKIIYSQCFIF